MVNRANKLIVDRHHLKIVHRETRYGSSERRIRNLCIKYVNRNIISYE